MDYEDGVDYFKFKQCFEGHPDDHWRLDPLCQAPTLVADHRNKPDPAVCGRPRSTFEHNDIVTEGEMDRKHEFVPPTEPLVWGENAWRINACPGYIDTPYEPVPEGEEPVRPKHCTCQCHWGTYYVNVYRLDRSWGGSEEGGWWYDTGSPVASVPFDTLREAEAERTRLEERFPSTKSRYSMAATTDDFGTRIEREFAAYWPEERPRYE